MSRVTHGKIEHVLIGFCGSKSNIRREIHRLFSKNFPTRSLLGKINRNCYLKEKLDFIHTHFYRQTLELD